MTDTLAPRPEHVHPRHVFDFDIYNFPIDDADYARSFARLHAADVPEVFWTPRNGGHWVVTRAEEIDAVLNEHTKFSSRHIIVPKLPEGTPLLKPIQADPPEHLVYRNLLASALSPKAVEALGRQARALTIELIDSFKQRGHCEFISEFAQHLPIAIFMKIVDLPEADRHHLTSTAEATIRGATDEERQAAQMQLAGYGMQKVMERRANPGTDLISTLATARIDGELIDDFTLTGMITLLLVAGLDTVASTLGFFARFLAMSPAHRQQLVADPSLIPNATEELLRRFPVAVLGRQLKADVDMKGALMKVGDMVVVPTQLEGLDERRFPDALSVNFSRRKLVHATFGGGVHRCMGSMLARTELRIFLEEWLQRIPDFSIQPGAHVQVAARSVATIVSLPLVWDPASTR